MQFLFSSFFELILNRTRFELFVERRKQFMMQLTTFMICAMLNIGYFINDVQNKHGAIFFLILILRSVSFAFIMAFMKLPISFG